MARKSTQRVKHVPHRTCIGCRMVQAKRNLIRLVRTREGVLVDTSGKLTGRGAYLHDRRSCWEQGLKGSLSRALKVDLTPENREHLLTYMESLPEAPEDDSGENSM